MTSTINGPVDRDAPIRFLQSAYRPDDWVAVFLKSYETGRAVQRVGPVAMVLSPRFQAWLRLQNARHYGVYVSVNAIASGSRTRTRAAVAAIRHLFLDVDDDAPAVVGAVEARSDLPPLSYILESSPNRAHLFWRVTEFTADAAEAVQKDLARELRTDPAATPCTQTTRLPGFLNHKYRPAHLVTIEYRSTDCVYLPSDFPKPSHPTTPPNQVASVKINGAAPDVLVRAERYLAALPSAIAGQHGDLHTFRVCCRLVRGFALSDSEALRLLADWNARCQPPWSERELADKLRRARRYGREPVGGLLEAQR